jgi:hypothetical protein
LSKLVQEIVNYLQFDGWKVQSTSSTNKALIQANKGGILRTLIAANRSLNILIEQNEDSTKVSIGVGKWLENIAVTALESLLLSEIFLVIDVPEMLWNEVIENNLIKKIDEIVNLL